MTSVTRHLVCQNSPILPLLSLYKYWCHHCFTLQNVPIWIINCGHQYDAFIRHGGKGNIAEKNLLSLACMTTRFLGLLLIYSLPSALFCFPHLHVRDPLMSTLSFCSCSHWEIRAGLLTGSPNDGKRSGKTCIVMEKWSWSCLRSFLALKIFGAENRNDQRRMCMSWLKRTHRQNS